MKRSFGQMVSGNTTPAQRRAIAMMIAAAIIIQARARGNRARLEVVMLLAFAAASQWL